MPRTTKATLLRELARLEQFGDSMPLEPGADPTPLKTWPVAELRRLLQVLAAAQAAVDPYLHDRDHGIPRRIAKRLLTKVAAAEYWYGAWIAMWGVRVELLPDAAQVYCYGFLAGFGGSSLTEQAAAAKRTAAATTSRTEKHSDRDEEIRTLFAAGIQRGAKKTFLHMKLAGVFNLTERQVQRIVRSV